MITSISTAALFSLWIIVVIICANRANIFDSSWQISSTAGGYMSLSISGELIAAFASNTTFSFVHEWSFIRALRNTLSLISSSVFNPESAGFCSAKLAVNWLVLGLWIAFSIALASSWSIDVVAVNAYLIFSVVEWFFRNTAAGVIEVEHHVVRTLSAYFCFFVVKRSFNFAADRFLNVVLDSAGAGDALLVLRLRWKILRAGVSAEVLLVGLLVGGFLWPPELISAGCAGLVVRR